MMISGLTISGQDHVEGRVEHPEPVPAHPLVQARGRRTSPCYHAARSGAKSARVTGGKPRRRSTRLRADAESFAGAVISMPMGFPLRLKSMTRPGSTRLLR